MLQVFLFITNNGIQHYSLICTQWNGSNVTLTIQLNISHFFTHKWMIKVLFLTIRFYVSHLFAHSLHMKQIYLNHRWCYFSGTERTWKRWQWKGKLHDPKLKRWSFTIRLSDVISRALGEFKPFSELQSVYSAAPADWVALRGEVLPIFVSASHQTGLDSRSMTQRSIIVGIRWGDGMG